MQLESFLRGWGPDESVHLALLCLLAENREGLLRVVHNGPIEAEVMQTLETYQARLERQVHDAPENLLLRQRLAFACFLLGEAHHASGSFQAAELWRKAYELNREVARVRPRDLFVLQTEGQCASRLQTTEKDDRFYPEAVSALERVHAQWVEQQRRNPDHARLGKLIGESLVTLAICHQRAGQAAGVEAVQKQLQEYLAAVRKRVNQHSWEELDLLILMHRVGAALLETEHPAGALALARQVAVGLQECADDPMRDFELTGAIADAALDLSALLRRLGDPAEAANLADLARRLFAGLSALMPTDGIFAARLSDAWNHVGKARWALGQHQEALAPFRESAVIQQIALANAGNVELERERLSRCYGRITEWSKKLGDWTAAADALGDREKLWLQDPGQLADVADDFESLAEAMQRDARHLDPRMQAERTHCLDQAARIRRAVQRLKQP